MKYEVMLKKVVEVSITILEADDKDDAYDKALDFWDNEINYRQGFKFIGEETIDENIVRL